MLPLVLSQGDQQRQAHSSRSTQACNPLLPRSLRGVPTELLTGCSSLATLGLHGNPATAEQLRETPGWAQFDARRRRKYDKQVRRRCGGGGRRGSGGAAERAWLAA